MSSKFVELRAKLLKRQAQKMAAAGLQDDDESVLEEPTLDLEMSDVEVDDDFSATAPSPSPSPLPQSPSTPQPRSPSPSTTTGQKRRFEEEKEEAIDVTGEDSGDDDDEVVVVSDETTATFWLNDARKRQFYKDFVRFQIRQNKNPFDYVKHLGLRSVDDIDAVGKMIFEAFDIEGVNATPFLERMVE